MVLSEEIEINRNALTGGRLHILKSVMGDNMP